MAKRKNKVRGSFAVYRDKKTGVRVCKIKELATILLRWGEIPNHIGDMRAQEIAMLAENYLRLREICHRKLGYRP